MDSKDIPVVVDMPPALARGKVAINDDDKLGVIAEYKYGPSGGRWEGVGFDGSFWHSKKLMIVADSINEFFKKE